MTATPHDDPSTDVPKGYRMVAVREDLLERLNRYFSRANPGGPRLSDGLSQGLRDSGDVNAVCLLFLELDSAQARRLTHYQAQAEEAKRGQ